MRTANTSALRATVASSNGEPIDKLCDGLLHAKGIYLLLVEARRSITIGRLGALDFEGLYVYVGSAQGTGGLQRIARHLRYPPGGGRPLRWHVDGLLAYGTLHGALVGLTEERKECILATDLRRSLVPSFRGFGSTDCSCLTHLFLAPSREAALEEGQQALAGLGLKPYVIRHVPEEERRSPDPRSDVVPRRLLDDAGET